MQSVSLAPRARALLVPEIYAGLPRSLRGRDEIVALEFASTGAGGARAKEAYLAAFAFNLARLDRLDRALSVLERAEVRAVPFKGAALVRTRPAAARRGRA